MHFLPPLAAAVAMFMIAAVWYSLFARRERLLAPGAGDGTKPPASALGQSFFVYFLIALIFQRLLYFVHTPNALHGAHTNVIICLGTVVASKYLQKTFRQGSWKLFFIDSGF